MIRYDVSVMPGFAQILTSPHHTREDVVALYKFFRIVNVQLISTDVIEDLDYVIAVLESFISCDNSELRATITYLNKDFSGCKDELQKYSEELFDFAYGDTGAKLSLDQRNVILQEVKEILLMKW